MTPNSIVKRHLTEPAPVESRIQYHLAHSGLLNAELNFLDNDQSILIYDAPTKRYAEFNGHRDFLEFVRQDPDFQVRTDAEGHEIDFCWLGAVRHSTGRTGSMVSLACELWIVGDDDEGSDDRVIRWSTCFFEE